MHLFNKFEPFYIVSPHSYCSLKSSRTLIILHLDSCFTEVNIDACDPIHIEKIKEA